ncbi:MAG TPA: hypothetical protein ENI26_08625 [Methylophaga aminisulfidivorans]|nr:hypothetical protein [Methylophaga aminisulfidivorans]
MKRTDLKPISVEYVAAFHGRERAGKDTQTWLVSLVGHEKKAYLKLTDNGLLTITELAASQVGSSLGLNIPTPYLVELTRGDIPDYVDFTINDVTYCFASESCGEGAVSFERLGAENKITQNWKDKDQTIIFDEWIANTDRHQGNLVFTPENKTFWLIDHGRALGGMPSEFFDLSNPAIDVNNQLLKDISPTTEEYKRHLAEKANQLMLSCKCININQLDKDNNFIKISPSFSKQDVITFLTERIELTVQILCKKLGGQLTLPMT